MARPREPIDLIAAKGRKHLTKAEYEERKKGEIQAPCDKVAPPAYLTKKEKDRFNDIAKELIDIGIMSNLDCDVLARYVRAVTEYEKVTRQLSKIKFAPDKKSNIDADTQIMEQTTQYNYLLKIQVRIVKLCNELARDLGLTISSRCRLAIPKTEEQPKENKFMKHA